MKELYAPFTRTGAPIMVMDCAERRADEVRRQRHAGDAHLVHERDRQRLRGGRRRRRSGPPGRRPDRRIGPSFLFPGVGYGGCCFPKDVKAIMRFAADKDYDFRDPAAVEAVNESQKRSCRKMERTSAGSRARRIAVWGLAFKPKTDDMREAPSRAAHQRLLAAGREGAGLRPRGDQGRANDLRRPITYADTAYER